MGKWVSCIKWTVLGCNLIFWLLGLAILGVGIFLRVDPTIQPVLDGSQNLQNYHVATYVLMAVGSLMAVIGFLGFCGALRESRCLLATFFGLLMVIFIGEISSGVVLYLYKNELTKDIEKGFSDLVRMDFGKPDFKTKTQYFDVMQWEMECCGARAYTDWFGSYWGGGKNDIGSNGTKDYLVPLSCCKKQFRGLDACQPQPTGEKEGIQLNLMSENTEMINIMGCATKLTEFMKDNRSIIIGVTVTVGLLQVLGLILSIILCCVIKPQDYGYKS